MGSLWLMGLPVVLVERSFCKTKSIKSMNSTPTCWGILGSGKIANDFIVALKTLPAEEHKIVAIGARSLDKAQQLCKQHGVQKAYGSYEDVVADKEIEVVYVSVIHPAHKKLCLLALEHGKHVLCEKPFTMNLQDAKEVLEKAREKKLFLMEVSDILKL